MVVSVHQNSASCWPAPLAGSLCPEYLPAPSDPWVVVKRCGEGKRVLPLPFFFFFLLRKPEQSLKGSVSAEIIK